MVVVLLVILLVLLVLLLRTTNRDFDGLVIVLLIKMARPSKKTMAPTTTSYKYVLRSTIA